MYNQRKNINSLWNILLSNLEKDLNRPIFETLISQALPLSVEDETMVIGVPNPFSRDWLSDKCGNVINEALTVLKQEGISQIRFMVTKEAVVNEKETVKEEADNKREVNNIYKDTSIKTPQPTKRYSNLNPRYTFDDFVIGHGNRFAHAAAVAVAESPAKAYNPLFIYGGVGLGKTHLIQAIGISAIQKNPGAKVLYVTSEQFTNDLINSIRYDKTQGFREKYRNIDLLIIDDIQFLAGKERTQEEFFHTFNSLYEASKQIIVTSDRPPKEIPTLEERLRSRFEWGLTADIQAPDWETRIAILKKKAENNELTIPDEVFSFISSKITSNIRELEGALIRVVAHASVNHEDVSLKSAEKALEDFVSPARGRPVSISLIKKVTAEYYTVRIDDMSAKIRTKEIATARQVAMYLARKLTDSSLPKIGSEFGGRDHTTVMHACEKIKQALLNNQPEIEEAVRIISVNLEKYTG